MVMRLPTLDRKLLRDLSRLKAQATAVSAVLACGVALFVAATGMYSSLERARDTYYDTARMAHVAASVVRAPDPVATQLAALPGVDALETRVTGIGLLDLPGKSDPVSAVRACGVALFVAATGMYSSLERARDTYYDTARMAHVAASVVRAPDPVATQLAALPGVDALETRVTGIGLLDLPGKSDPVS